MSVLGAKRTTVSEIIAIDELLKQYLAKTEHGGYMFLPGWDDRKIANKVGSHLTDHHVARIRKERYGNVVHHTTTRSNPLRDRMDDLEKRVTALEVALK